MPSWWTRFRSAITGRFIRRSEADKRPDATVGEQVDRDVVTGRFRKRDDEAPKQ